MSSKKNKLKTPELGYDIGITMYGDNILKDGGITAGDEIIGSSARPRMSNPFPMTQYIKPPNMVIPKKEDDRNIVEYETGNWKFGELGQDNMNKKQTSLFIYPLLIDSINRDINIFKNPYDMGVKVGGGNNQVKPFILSNKLENIKYLELDKVLMPNNYRLSKELRTNTGDFYTYLDGLIDTTDTTVFVEGLINTTQVSGANTYNIINITYAGVSGALTTWTIEVYANGNYNETYFYDYNNGGTPLFYRYYYHSLHELRQERYLVVDISEINTNKHTTSEVIFKGFCAVIEDYSINGTSKVMLMANNIKKVYKEAELGKLNSLKIVLFDAVGNKLENPHINYDISTATEINNYSLNTNGTDNIQWNSSKYYIRHPLFNLGQVLYFFKVGMYEPEFVKEHFDDKITK